MLNILQTFQASKKEFRFSRYFKPETVYSQCRLKTGNNKHRCVLVQLTSDPATDLIK